MTPNSGPSIEPLRGAKSAIQWFTELKVPFDGDITIRDIIAIQEDAVSQLQREVESLRGELESLRANPKYRTPAEYDKQSRHLQQAHAALKKAKVAFETFNKPLYQPGAHQHDIVNEIRSRDQLFSDALTAIKECGL